MPLQCGTWKKRLRAVTGPIWTGSNMTSYLGSRIDSLSPLVAVHLAALMALLQTQSLTFRQETSQFPHPWVNEVVGVGTLRSSWVNVDRLWAGALRVGAMAT